MSLENPYAPPVGPIEAAAQPASAFPLTRRDILRRGVVCSLIGGGFVLSCQMLFGSSTFRQPLLSSAAMGMSAVVILFAFGVYGVSYNKKRGRNTIFAMLLTPLALSGIFIAESLLELSEHPLRIVVALGLLCGSQLAIALVILRMHDQPIRPTLLMATSLLATVAWMALTFAIIWAVVQHLSHSLDDYVGYTSLTMFWSWTTVGQLLFVARAKGQTEPNTPSDVNSI